MKNKNAYSAQVKRLPEEKDAEPLNRSNDFRHQRMLKDLKSSDQKELKELNIYLLEIDTVFLSK